MPIEDTEAIDKDLAFLNNMNKRAQEFVNKTGESSNNTAETLPEDKIRIRSEQTESGSTRIVFNKRGERVLRGLTAIAAGVALAGGAAAGISLNNQYMEDSKTVVGTGSFMPSLETGETWGQADATVNQILEEGGIDPNKISYQEVGNALSPALDQEREVTEGPLSPGASFDTTIYEQTDLFGGKHYSVDIDSSKYIAQQDTNKDK